MLLEVADDKEKMALPEPVGAISANSLMLAPPGGKKPFVVGVTFSLNPGESLGIVGPSAAGKSTLSRAILGIWPAMNGNVRLDGVDIYEWSREELGPSIGYLPQDIELFDGTISENISRFGGIDPEKVVAAAKLADVHEMILALPGGYDTVIGSVGGVLSGGQRQRIGLARAVYGDPKLILLDEPNSNLDENGEAALARALEALKLKNTTVIVVTHRPGILSVLDKLLVMDKGTMTAFGPRQEVINQLKQQMQPAVQPQKSGRVGASALTVPPVF